MIIRATKKLLNVSGIKPVINPEIPRIDMPGEWYASTISMRRPGKMAVHLLHYPTFISIIIPGKSLNKVIPYIHQRTKALLNRLGFSTLEPLYQLNTPSEIFATNSKSILAYINQIKRNIEYHFADSISVDSIDWNRLEDIHNDWIFLDKSPKGYFTPVDRLKNIRII